MGRQPVAEMITTVPDKQTMRREALARRIVISGEKRRVKEARILERLSTLPEFLSARTVALYASFRGEVDTSLLAAQCRQMRKMTVFPRVDRAAKALVLYEVTDSTGLKEGFRGIPEPSASGRTVDIGDIDLVIVPGLAFDSLCSRLGYGLGFYDDLLSIARPFSVAICFEEQMCESIPYESHDVPMDVVVTDERIIRRHGHEED